MISFSSFPRRKACELWGAQNAFSSANLGRHVGSLGLGAKPPSPPPHPTPRISGSKSLLLRSFDRGSLGAALGRGRKDSLMHEDRGELAACSPVFAIPEVMSSGGSFRLESTSHPPQVLCSSPQRLAGPGRDHLPSWLHGFLFIIFFLKWLWLESQESLAEMKPSRWRLQGQSTEVEKMFGA